MLFSFFCRRVHTLSVCGVRNALEPRPVYGLFRNLFHSVYIRKVRAYVEPRSQLPPSPYPAFVSRRGRESWV